MRSSTEHDIHATADSINRLALVCIKPDVAFVQVFLKRFGKFFLQPPYWAFLAEVWAIWVMCGLVNLSCMSKFIKRVMWFMHWSSQNSLVVFPISTMSYLFHDIYLGKSLLGIYIPDIILKSLIETFTCFFQFSH